MVRVVQQNQAFRSSACKMCARGLAEAALGMHDA